MTKWAVIIVVLLAITISGCGSNGKSNDNITDVGEATTVNNSQENIGNNTEEFNKNTKVKDYSSRKNRFQTKAIFNCGWAEKILGDNRNRICMVLSMLKVMLLTGMRISEVVRLCWSDIDYDNDVIHIRRALFSQYEYGKKKLHFTTTKTINSVRDIPMMADCKKMLKLQKRIRIR